MESTPKPTLEPTKKKPKKYRVISRKAKLMLIGGFLIIVIGSYLVHILGVPAHGSSATILPATSKKNSAPVVPAGQIDEKYYTLDTPAGFAVQTNIPTVPGVLASSMLTHASASGTQIISVAVSSAVDGGLQSNTSYAIRMADTARYTFEQTTVAGEQIAIASDTQASGAVSFWLHGGYIATIGVRSGYESAGGGANTEEVKTIKTLLANWHWAQ